MLTDTDESLDRPFMNVYYNEDRHVHYSFWIATEAGWSSGTGYLGGSIRGTPHRIFERLERADPKSRVLLCSDPRGAETWHSPVSDDDLELLVEVLAPDLRCGLTLTEGEQHEGKQK